MAKPDNNPLDCEAGGHGTHVSGTTAYYGVGEDGKTFRGDHTKLTKDQVGKMRIGPGTAPGAELIGLRVFGCEGSTNLVIDAMDRALDPNMDGDFSDKADIINMSLGSDFGPADDPQNDLIDALSRQGILSVIAAGNMRRLPRDLRFTGQRAFRPDRGQLTGQHRRAGQGRGPVPGQRQG